MGAQPRFKNLQTPATETKWQNRMRRRTNAASAIALALLTATALVPTAHAQTLTKIADFTSATGGGGKSLVIDSNGNLFGATPNGGTSSLGTVFEVAKTGLGYGTVTIIATFTGNNGSKPLAGISFDAGGNLFGTTSQGGANSVGTVFELANTGSGYGPISTIARK